ncbi:MAG: hypothetical protein K2X27_23185 [Candidatus Obscuribacterales bacterium]|nr:hypothetical protein [Candidatus Obscuribacterales bacterium]
MNRRKSLLSITFGIIAGLVVCNKSMAVDQLARPYEWTIEIQSEKLAPQFHYAGSKISEIVKTKIQYYSMTNESAKTAFEDLWYSKGKALGLERHHSLDIKQGDAIAIRVLHKNDSAPEDEQQAAGKAIAKAILAASLNKNMVATVKVPYSSFHRIVSEIEEYNFHPSSDTQADTPISADMNLFIESEPAGLHQALCHYH